MIKDDSPGSASNTGHQLIVGIFCENPILMTLRGPERPGLLIENWPIVTSVTDDEVSFQYDDDQASFALRIDALLRDAKRIKKLQGD